MLKWEMDEQSIVSGRNIPLALPNFDCLVDEFLRSHDVKPSSRESYRRRLKNFFLYCIQNQVREPTRETIIGYKRYLIDKKHTSYTVSGRLVAVRVFFQWAHSMKFCEDITRGIKGQKRPRTFLKNPLTIAQATQLLASIDRSTLLGKRDYALLNLALKTAARGVEILRADVGDIKQNSGEALLFLQRKNSDTKDSPTLLLEGTLTPILEYLSARGPVKGDDPLFASVGDGNFNSRLSSRTVSKIAKDRLRAIGLNSNLLTLHSLRHSCLTYAILAGATLEQTQTLAAHSSPATTMIYNHAVDSWRGIAERKVDNLFKEYQAKNPSTSSE